MKYIIYNKGHLLDLVVLFDRLTTHDEIARNLGSNIKIVSAGFVSLGVAPQQPFTPAMGIPNCYGKSVSLNKRCRPEIDTEIIRKYFYNEQGY